MDVKRYHSLNSPVASSLIKIMNLFLNNIYGPVKFFRFICFFKIFNYIALEIKWGFRSSTFLLNNSFLTISQLKIIMTLVLWFSLISLKTLGFAICINSLNPSISSISLISFLLCCLDSLTCSLTGTYLVGGRIINFWKLADQEFG